MEFRPGFKQCTIYIGTNCITGSNKLGMELDVSQKERQRLPSFWLFLVINVLHKGLIACFIPASLKHQLWKKRVFAMLKTAIIVDIHTEKDIVAARKRVKQLAQTLHFSSINQVRISTAVSELARNIYLYAGKGTISFEAYFDENKIGIKLTATDQGPGIPSVRKVLEDGYSTSGGLGMGLPGVKRLMDEFVIDSGLGIGTTIIAVKWV